MNKKSGKLTWRDLLTDPTQKGCATAAAIVFSTNNPPMPETRGDCTHKRSFRRPCPYWKCRHHVALDFNEARGVFPSGAKLYGPSCVLDLVDERSGLPDVDMPSGPCMYTGEEIEKTLGLSQRTSYEVVRSEVVREAFEALADDLLRSQPDGFGSPRRKCLSAEPSDL